MDDRERVEQIVSRAFPRASVDRVADRSGMAHRTVVADLSGADRARVVARWCLHDHLADRFRQEAGVLSHMAAHTDLPVPDVLHHDRGGPSLLLSFLPGTHRANRFWRPHPLSHEELRAAGEMLGKLHAALPQDDAGHVVTGGGLEVVPRAWPEMLRDLVASHLDQLEQVDGYPFADLLPALRETLDDHVDRAAAPDPVLLHHDFRPSNLLFRNGRVTGVVDWERAMSGDPLYDLVKAEMNFVALFPGDVREERWAAFVDGYREHRAPHWSMDRVPLYRFLHTVEILWAAPFWLQTYSEADRARIVNELRTVTEKRMAALD